MEPLTGKRVKLPLVQKQVGEFHDKTNKPNGDLTMVQKQIGEFKTGKAAPIPPQKQIGEFDKGAARQKTGRVGGRRGKK